MEFVAKEKHDWMGDGKGIISKSQCHKDTEELRLVICELRFANGSELASMLLPRKHYAVFCISGRKGLTKTNPISNLEF